MRLSFNNCVFFGFLKGILPFSTAWERLNAEAFPYDFPTILYGPSKPLGRKGWRSRRQQRDKCIISTTLKCVFYHTLQWKKSPYFVPEWLTTYDHRGTSSALKYGACGANGNYPSWHWLKYASGSAGILVGTSLHELNQVLGW